MNTALLASMLLLGLASGVHCVGMCGGFVAAFSSARVIPIQPARAAATRLLLFNAGRVTTYAVLGAASGFFGGKVALALGAQTALYVLANVMLVAIGLHLAGATRVIGLLERLGNPAWRLAQRLLGMRNAYLPRLAWGSIPCGLVYGIGTLPWLLSAGATFQIARKPWLRTAVGAGVLGFGLYGLAQAGVLHAGGAASLRGWICL